MLCSFTKSLETVNFKWATQSSSTNTPPSEFLIRRRSVQFPNSPSSQLTCRTVFLIPPQLHSSMAAASIPSNGDVHTAGSNYAEIIVIRHGETLWNADGRIQGHLDVDLNEVGRQQAEIVAARLSKEPKISAVYSSDLKRAHETAEIIARNCGGLEVIKDRDLRERHLGALQGVVYHEIVTINPEAHKAFVSKSLDQEIPGGGESLNQLYLRATSCLQKIGDKHRGQRVVIVTHGGLIRALHRRATTHDRVGKVLNTSVNVFHLSDGGKWTIKTWGDVSHLSKTGFLKSGFGGDSNSG
ncbi:Phosphoglycerate mutase-like protein 4 [Heracleum sosnowskyi]|uniref:Phosphoglycerate mutase-like protein 4 n=1 Tax=Heracleum sosnowskyi TaxID=360622 RepID=A0AAD8H9Y4_9APIA|nr:Phosphoglycerate mutase-like protein 4 [Heracleum sosnowskyi]